MHFSDPKDQADFDSRHSTMGVKLCHPNERQKSDQIYREVRQALAERRPLFLVGKKKTIDRNSHPS